MTAAGISVIPIARNKLPALPWKEFQSRIASDSELEQWFGRPDHHGIAIVCGAVSGNLEVLDFDLRHLPDLHEVVNTFRGNVLSDLGEEGLPEGAPGILDRVTLIETPGPGAQLVYRCESAIGGSQKLAAHNGTKNPETGEDTGGPGYFIETRGEGGYALTCGSPPFCHPKGGAYLHRQGPRIHELEPITVAERDTLLINARWIGNDGERFESPREMAQALLAPQEASVRPTSVSPPIQLSATPSSSVGDDFAARTPWSEILTPHGFELVGRDGEAEHWKRPGTSNPMSATTNYSDSGLFYTFSPNCGHRIEPNRGYNKFAIYALLNHAGDFSAAASELAVRGFGEQRDLSHIDIEGALSEETGPTPENENPFNFQTFRDFMSVVEETDYLCDDILAAGQSCILAGPEKSLKTGISIDLCYSLATGTPFLGRFACKKPLSVGVMTGESNRPKLQRLFATRAAADGESCSGYDPRIAITSSLPDLSVDEQLQMMETAIRLHQMEVLIIDPTYMCLGEMADHTSNVSKMGNMLRRFQAIGMATGCTLVLLHHTNRKHEPFKPLQLRDMSGAGFAEWVRQWLLICPRKPFDAEGHRHCLWMVAGGSAGHAGKYAVDVREKDDRGEWAWIREARPDGEERAEYLETKKAGEEQEKRDIQAEFARDLTDALEAGLANSGSTANDLKDWFRENTRKNAKWIKVAKLEEFERNGFAKRGVALRGNNKPTEVWLPAGAAAAQESTDSTGTASPDLCSAPSNASLTSLAS